MNLYSNIYCKLKSIESEYDLQELLSIILYNYLYNTSNDSIVLSFHRIGQIAPDYIITNFPFGNNKIAVLETKYISNESSRGMREKILKILGQIMRYKSLLGLPVYLIINEEGFRIVSDYLNIYELDPGIGIITISTYSIDKNKLFISINTRKNAYEYLSSKLYYLYQEILPISTLYGFCSSIGFFKNDDIIKGLFNVINPYIYPTSSISKVISNYNILLRGRKLYEDYLNILKVDYLKSYTQFKKLRIYGLLNLLEYTKAGILGSGEHNSYHYSFILSYGITGNEPKIEELLFQQVENILKMIEFVENKINDFEKFNQDGAIMFFIHSKFGKNVINRKPLNNFLSCLNRLENFLRSFI